MTGSGIPISHSRSPRPMSASLKQQQYDQHDQQQAGAARGVLAPAGAVRPDRQGAEKDQQKQNQQHEAHGAPLLLAGQFADRVLRVTHCAAHAALGLLRLSLLFEPAVLHHFAGLLLDGARRLFQTTFDPLLVHGPFSKSSTRTKRAVDAASSYASISNK